MEIIKKCYQNPKIYAPNRFFSQFYAESVTKSPKGGASFLFLSVSLLEICTTELVKTYVNIGELGSPARKEYFV